MATMDSFDAVPSVAARATQVRERIDAACRAAGRDPSERFADVEGRLIRTDLGREQGLSYYFVAGGVPSKVRGWLLDSSFGRRMVDKDVMRPVLERIPVRLIEDPAVGLIGAASWFLQRG